MGTRNVMELFLWKGAVLLGLGLGSCETRPARTLPPEKVVGLEPIKLENLCSRYLDLVSRIHPSHLLAGSMERDFPFSLEVGKRDLEASENECMLILDQALEIPDASLTEPQRIERKFLCSKLKSLLIEFQGIQPFSRDPGVYLDELEAGIVLYLQAGKGPQEVEGLVSWLNGFRKALAVAFENLGFCPEVFISQAMERARALSACLEEGRLTEGLCSGSLAKDLDRAVERACNALKWYADELAARKRELSPGPFTWGEETLTAMLREEGIYSPPPLLMEKLGKDMSRLERDVRRSLHADSLGTAWRRLETMKYKGKIYAPASAGNARDFCVKEGIFIRGNARGRPWKGLLASKYIIDGDIFAGDRADRGHGSSEWERMLRIARDSWPGFSAFKSKLELSGSVLARSCPSPLFVHGWLSYSEDLVAERNLFTPLEAARGMRRLKECVLAYIAIGIHTGKITLGQAVSLIERKCLADKKEAKDLAVRTARTPLSFLGYLGMKLIRELRFEFKKAHEKAYSLAFFHEALFSTGPVSFALLDNVFSRAFGSH